MSATAARSSSSFTPACRFAAPPQASVRFCDRGRGGCFCRQCSTSNSEAGQGGGLHVHAPIRRASDRRGRLRGGGRRRAGGRRRRPRSHPAAASHRGGTSSCYGHRQRAVIETTPALGVTCPGFLAPVLRRAVLRRAQHVTPSARVTTPVAKSDSHARGGCALGRVARSAGDACAAALRRLLQVCLAAGRAANSEQAVRERTRCKCVVPIPDVRTPGAGAHWVCSRNSGCSGVVSFPPPSPARGCL
jgi:hypothetical protein